MRAQWHPYLAAKLPRYTSYPTATSFSGAVGCSAFNERLCKVAPYEPITIYIHIPPDMSLCCNCGCTPSTCDHYDRAIAYVQTLIDDIAQVGKRLSGRGRVTGVQFGGGPANFLLGRELALILDAVESAFGLPDNADVAMEIDPRLISYSSAEMLSALGVNRVNLGVQDFDPDVQRAIGRVQPFEHVAQVVSAFRNFGVFDINLDLLYGLPHQTCEGLLKTLAMATSLVPDGISLRGYLPAPSAMPVQTLFDEATLPAPLARFDHVLAAQAYLVQHGYDLVGFDHFSKPDAVLACATRKKTLKLRFQGFTATPATILLGFGQSAISQFEDTLFQNHKDLSDYRSCVARGHSPAYQGVRVSSEDQARAKIIEDLLCYLSADIAARCRQFGVDLACLKPSLDRIEVLCKGGLLGYSNGKILIVEEARLISRVVASCFDAHLPEIMQSAYAV